MGSWGVSFPGLLGSLAISEEGRVWAADCTIGSGSLQEFSRRAVARREPVKSWQPYFGAHLCSERLAAHECRAYDRRIKLSVSMGRWFL